MTTRPRQLTLDLAQRPALGAEDFLVSGSNEVAVEMIDRWPDWPHWAAVVTGPAGAGKSHLAHVWRLKSGAAVESATALSEGAVDKLEQHAALVVEDIHRGIASERALFHLLNLAREHKLSILLTSQLPPGALSITVPDLRSRLRALPVVDISPPDDALLKAVLVKLFADRQLAVEPRVVNYLGRHMERSLGAATRVVAAADRLALERRAPVSVRLAREVLEALRTPESAG